MKLLYVDLFCGAGGVTTGVSRVPGVQVVACVNHDAKAIASHAANHPETLHFTEDIRTLDTAPMVSRMEEMRRHHPLARVVLWASCECTNFSRAKGGKPRDPDSRSLAEHLYRYIEALRPDYIQVENVTEFLEWGPLVGKAGKLVPDPSLKGEFFRAWFDHIESMGFRGGRKVFNAADFGAYTSRKRLFVQFARHGLDLVWPQVTHSRRNWKPCRDVLDLSNFGQSIFARKKTLCDATLRRLAEGVRKFARPRFVVRYMSGPGHVHSVDRPCVTVCTDRNLYLATGHFVDNYYGRGYPSSLDEPIGTLCTKSQKYPVTVVFMANYYSGGGQLTDIGQPCPALLTNPKSHVATVSYIRAMMRPQSRGLVYSLTSPMPTLLTRDYFYLDTCKYAGCPVYHYPEEGDTEAMLELKTLMRERGIADICMRPLTVTECLRVMGFPDNYKLTGTQTDQRKFIGNAVEVHQSYHMALALAEDMSDKGDSQDQIHEGRRIA